MSSISSYLTSLFSSAVGSGDSLLNTLYGLSGTSSSGQNAVQALQSAEKTETKQIQLTAKKPDVQRDINTFTQAVTSAKNVAQLLSNPTVMKVLLTANGLGDQLNYTALATKALTSDLTNSKSLANTLTDTRWKSVAATYNFASKGLAVIQDPKVISVITNAYAQVTWENSQDAVTPGLSNALAFKNKASSATTVDQILADPTLRTVVTTALGIPVQIAFQDLDAQEKAITNRLDIKKLQDPKFVEQFAQRYLIANSGTSSASTSTDLTTLALQTQGRFV